VTKGMLLLQAHRHSESTGRDSWPAQEAHNTGSAAITPRAFFRLRFAKAECAQRAPPLRCQSFRRSRPQSSARFSWVRENARGSIPVCFSQPLSEPWWSLRRCNMVTSRQGRGVCRLPSGAEARSGCCSAGSVTAILPIHSVRFGSWCVSPISWTSVQEDTSNPMPAPPPDQTATFLARVTVPFPDIDIADDIAVRPDQDFADHVGQHGGDDSPVSSFARDRWPRLRCFNWTARGRPCSLIILRGKSSRQAPEFFFGRRLLGKVNWPPFSECAVQRIVTCGPRSAVGDGP